MDHLTLPPPELLAADECQPNRPVFPLRRDLEVSEQFHRGRHYAVVKDPIAMEFFRLTWTDYELAKLLAGCATFEQWLNRWRENYASLRDHPRDRLAAKAKTLLINLESRGLCTLPAAALLIYTRSKEQQRRKTRPIRWMTSWLTYRKSLFDPDALLTRITPALGFLFNPWFTAAWLALLAGAIAILITHSRDINLDFGWFFSFENLALLFVCLIVMKVIHEFGHGVTCKHYGGEVHEAGFMMMALHPLFYVNVSDAWLIPKKSQRIAVSAAGVYVELIFAVILTYIWVLLSPGFLKQLALNGILVASVTTLIFNANPLMRFDGYFILADWLEIPNLRQRSMQFIGAKFRKLFFGRNDKMQALSPEIIEQSRALAIYATLSFLYLVVVMWNVLHMLDNLLDMVGLRFVAHLLVIMWVTASLGFPIVMFFARPLNDKRLALTSNQRRRPVIVTILAVIAVVLILSIPWEKTVTRACVFEFAAPFEIRAEQPGFVTAVLYKEGDLVEKDEVVVELRNPEFESLAASQQEALREVETLLNQAQINDKVQEYELFRRQRDELQFGLGQINEKIEALKLRSGIRGRLLTRNMKDFRGRYLKLGEMIASLGPEENFDIIVPLSEREARFVKKGDVAKLRLASLPESTFHGKVVQEPLTTISGKLPAALTARRGGDVASTVDSSGEETLLEKQWFAVLKIEESNQLLRPGMTGRVRIECGKSTVGKLIAQRLLDFINLDYRL